MSVRLYKCSVFRTSDSADKEKLTSVLSGPTPLYQQDGRSHKMVYDADTTNMYNK